MACRFKNFINRELFFFFGKLFYKIEFELLVFEKFFRVVRRDFFPAKRKIFTNKLFDGFFEFFQVVRHWRSWQEEVVIKPVFDYRADAEFRVRKFFHHCGGQQMRQRMADMFNIFCRFGHFSIIWPLPHF